MENTRFTQGMEQLKTIDGKGGENVIKSLEDIAPDLGKFIVEFAFGICGQKGVCGERTYPIAKQRYSNSCHPVQNKEEGHYNPFSSLLFFIQSQQPGNEDGAQFDRSAA